MAGWQRKTAPLASQLSRHPQRILPHVAERVARARPIFVHVANSHEDVAVSVHVLDAAADGGPRDSAVFSLPVSRVPQLFVVLASETVGVVNFERPRGG